MKNTPISFPAPIIGLMSGTSADGVDAALLWTDGQTIAEAGESLFIPYSAELRADILALMRHLSPPPAEAIARVSRALTHVHHDAVQALQQKTRTPAHAVGFHGQTIRHAPQEGITEQIGDAQWLADSLRLPVIFDFRSNDVRHGGQGAPLVPLYHTALAHALPKPLMVLNIGGVANVTWIGKQVPGSSFQVAGETGTPGTWKPEPASPLLAFDCGPGNALLDDWMARHTGTRYDQQGATAARGTGDIALVERFRSHDFFTLAAPKSLDRNQFAEILALAQHLSVADGAATLTAMTVAAIVQSLALVPDIPQQILVTGGGRHNPTMMAMLHAALAPPRRKVSINVAPVEAVGWDGDMLEAQAFAYLAARSMQGLPLSLPTTTGVKQPVSGGTVYYPATDGAG